MKPTTKLLKQLQNQIVVTNVKEGTDFIINLLFQEFGYCTDNKENIYTVLNGIYAISPGTDQYAKEFIKALKIPN